MHINGDGQRSLAPYAGFYWLPHIFGPVLFVALRSAATESAGPRANDGPRKAGAPSRRRCFALRSATLGRR